MAARICEACKLFKSLDRDARLVQDLQPTKGSKSDLCALHHRTHHRGAVRTLSDPSDTSLRPQTHWRRYYQRHAVLPSIMPKSQPWQILRLRPTMPNSEPHANPK